MPAILAIVSDLMFVSRLREVALALGYDFLAADTPDELRAGLDRSPALAVVDLHVTGIDWCAAVDTAKAAGVPILAFGRHTEAQLLRDARDAGCDRVVPRSQLVQELPGLISDLIRTPS